MFVRVVNWATVLCLALAAAFAGLLQWNECAIELYVPLAERDIARSLSFVPLYLLGFVISVCVASIVWWRFRKKQQSGPNASIGFMVATVVTFVTVSSGTLIRSPWSTETLVLVAAALLQYTIFAAIIRLVFRWQARSTDIEQLRSQVLSAESLTYVWLAYGALATPGLMTLGYLNFQLRWQPWVALLACAAYLISLRFALLLVYGLLKWPIMTEEEMAP